jgi:branched-chain amino acid transport system substrate-binding protein
MAIFRSRAVAISLALLLLTTLLVSCRPIRPVLRIGLLAPFEGLHRRSGYEALVAMRAAIAETPAGDYDILPLAVDDSFDAQRAAQKLLADPTVRAIIGPVTPADAALVAPVLHSAHSTPPAALPQGMDREVQWLLPFALDPAGGFLDAHHLAAWLTNERWAQQFVLSASRSLHANGYQRLLLAGATLNSLDRQPGQALLAEAIQQESALPVEPFQTLAQITEQDAIFWLGDAETGAEFFNQLRQQHAKPPFWLGMQSADPIFAERAAMRGPVFATIWSNAGYSSWAAQHAGATPFAYLVYQATRTAITNLSPSAPSKVLENATAWQVICLKIQPDRTSQTFDCTADKYN